MAKKKKKDKKAKNKKEVKFNLIESIQAVHFMYERKLDHTFSKFELSNEQFRILQILNEAPPEGLALKDIRESLPNQTSNATRLVEKLNAKNLLSKKNSRADKRSLKISLTPAGTETLTLAQNEISEVENQMKNVVKSKDEKTISAALLEISNALKQE